MGYLKQKSKINSDEYYDTYFWAGIPKSFRNIIEARLLTNDPSRDMSKPFGYDDVVKVATAYLRRDKFPTMIIDSDSDDDDTTLSDLSEDTSDSEDSDSDSDDEREQRKKRKEKKKSTLQKSAKKKCPLKAAADDDDEEDEKPIRRSKGSAQVDKQKHEEVEGLIRQLNKMSIDDTEYGATYYKALKIDSDIAKVVRAPQISPPPPAPALKSSYQSSGNFQRQTPPHMINATSSSSNRNGSRGRESSCKILPEDY